MNDTRTRKYKRYDEAFKRSAVEQLARQRQVRPTDRRRTGRQRAEPQAVEAEVQTTASRPHSEKSPARCAGTAKGIAAAWRSCLRNGALGPWCHGVTLQ